MAVHTTLDSLMERVMEQEARKYDLLADTRRMSIELSSERPKDEHDAEWTPITTVNVDQPTGMTSLDMNDHALGQMATDLGIPMAYFRRMRKDAPELFRTNVHHWMYEEPKRRMLRAYKSEADSAISDVGRAWLSDRYRRLDNIEIARKLLPEFDRLDTEVKFHNAAITDDKFYLRALFPRIEGEVKLNDPVQWGVQIRNSEVGAGQFEIENFVMRLICMNGMVVAKVMSARHVGRRLGDNLSDEAIRADDKAFWLAARDELRASMDESRFDEILTTLRETTDGPVITAPIAATERMAKTLELSDGEKEAVLTQLASNGDFTRWGALNAVTAAAKSVESFDRQVELEEIGWSMAEMTRSEWERIAVAA